ncbi:MAG: hypothetical protein ACYC9J_06935 [Sulfuricaulis sp.]
MMKIALVLALASALFFQAWNAAKIIPVVMGNHVITQQLLMP